MYPVSDGRFVALLDSVCGSLSGTISVRCLIPFGLFRGWVLTVGIYVSDQDDLIGI